ncbi:MAG: purine-binding chemotaxis protein CheW [Actinobacteria bacterium]|nr:MAG: purine-binding chemotaxis protein CheW [Actinomycetota bacterium]
MYLTFGLADETYGVDILRVQEIVGMMPLTRVPRLPDEVAGVVNLRGRVVPVIDLRSALGIPAAELTERSCIVIVRRDGGDAGRVTGLVVDEVSDVVHLGDDAVEETPEFGAAVDTSFITGIGRVHDRIVLLLDVDSVLMNDHVEDLSAVEVVASETVQ